MQIFIDGEEINSEKNFFSYFRAKEYALIKDFKFKEAYLIAEEMERFTDDLATKLLGDDLKIEEIKGRKYAYNPQNYFIDKNNNFVYDVYEMGQKIDRKGRIRIDKLTYLQKGKVLDDVDNCPQIKAGAEYKNLYTEYVYLYSENPDKITKLGILEPLNIRFMKDVIKIHGSYNILATAAKGVQDAVGDNTDSYIVKLFNGTLNTKEYKEAYKKSSMQDKDNILRNKKEACL